jgi:hypothetical protein
MGDHPTPEHILQTGLGFWASKVLLSAVEMGVFTELAHGPEDLETLRGRLGLHPRAARDFLDTLVALGFLERRNGHYSNTASTDLYLDKRKPSYIGGLLEMANHRLYVSWGHLTEAVRTGKPQNELRSGDTPLFEALYADPARLREFLAAMSGISRGAALAIAAKFPWSGYSSFVDVGTAQGDTAAQIALAHPHLRGTVLDLAETGPIFEDYIEGLDLSERLRFAAGNFFEHPLPKADVVIMGHILHDWDLRGDSGRRRPDYLRGHYRRRPLAERVRVDDEPEYADRDARRLRLHGSRLPRVDAGSRFPGDAGRTSYGSGFYGGGDQIGDLGLAPRENRLSHPFHPLLVISKRPIVMTAGCIYSLTAWCQDTISP